MAAPAVAAWVPGQPVVEDTPLQPVCATLGFALGDGEAWNSLVLKLHDRSIDTVGDLFDNSYKEASAMLDSIRDELTRVPGAYLKALESRCGMQFEGKAGK